LTILGPGQADERVLVGLDTHDDAGVFRLDSETALVQTVDYFTPVVDDPYQFGMIAAANALSDLYAMGARPLTALNLVGFPGGRLPAEILGNMLRGGRAVLEAAGVALLGGHSVDDPEPKMGYAVTGVVHPDRIWRNSTARPGDVLYLTKPIGTGVLVKAIKDAVAAPAEVDATVDTMRTLNRAAAEVLHKIGGPSACTDVTGFGLLGHAWEMASGSHAHLIIEASRVPLLPGALALAEKDRFPAGSRNNRAYFSPHVTVADDVPEALAHLLYDAVTSGGLLAAVPESRCEALEAEAQAASVPFHRIGRVENGAPGLTVTA
jgi:selenide,water dikinase